MRPGDKKIRRKVAFIEESRSKMGKKTFSTLEKKRWRQIPAQLMVQW